MTLSTTINTKSYTGDGSTTAFSFPYLFYQNSDLKVTLNGTLQTITTHYTVTGAENPNGGTVTFVTAPALDDAVIIQRVVSLVQETDFENFDGNPADVTEKQFDLLAMADQQLDEAIDRAILAPVGTSLTSNAITGTIDSTARILTITTAGPATATVASLSTSLDVILTSEASGDFLRYNGTDWVNVTEITADDLATDAVTTVKIEDDAVTFVKLATAGIASQAEAEAGTATDKLMTPERVSQAIDALAGGVIPNTGYATNRYYFGGVHSMSNNNATVTANRLYGLPFIVGESETFTRIGVEVTTLSAGNGRLGIYNMVDGVPTDLVLDAGEIDTGSTGNKEVTISLALTAGIYCVACVFDATPNVRRHQNGSNQIARHILGAATPATVASNQEIAFYAAHTYGALPDPFGSITYADENTPALFAVWLRKV